MSGIDFDDVPNWRGRDVIDQNGLAVGVISDIYVDDVTGRPEWAAVKPGLISHRLTFVPRPRRPSTACGCRSPTTRATSTRRPTSTLTGT